MSLTLAVVIVLVAVLIFAPEIIFMLFMATIGVGCIAVGCIGIMAINFFEWLGVKF